MKRFNRWLVFLALCVPGTALLAQTTPPGLIINGEATATLTWIAPTEYENGSPLAQSDIDGYVIFWSDGGRFLADGTTLRSGCTDKPEGSRNDSSCYPNVIDLSDGTSTGESLTLTLDQDVTLFFAAVTHDIGGAWSRYSNEASKAFALQIVQTEPNPPIMQSVDIDIICTTNLPTVTCTFSVTDP